MKNSKLRRALLLVACAVLLVSISVSATLAYLTSKTEVVTNTFSVGSVNITLDEAKVDEYGVANNNVARVQTNTYKLVPGHTYTKDPTVHVAKGSEECYLFVKVENGISDIEADVVITTTGENNTQTPETIGKIANQLTKYGWHQLEITKADGTKETVDNVYYYFNKVDARETAVDKLVFFQFKVDGEADIASCANASITVQAYAVQADGFNTALEAWNATATGFGKTPISATP